MNYLQEADIPFLFFSCSKALLFKKQSEDQPLGHHLGACHENRLSGDLLNQHPPFDRITK